jgi:two-component system response regulator ChvI
LRLGESLNPQDFMSASLSSTMPIRVLFVDGDKHYREILAVQLSHQGVALQGFDDGLSLLDSLPAADADIILLEWTPLKTSGIDLLPQLRRRGVNLPVVFLTLRALPAHERLAFDRGAVDVIDKARGMDVLVRRLKRAVEVGKLAADPDTEKRAVCGKLVLRSTISRACWNDVDVGLTVGEYKVVHLLASNVGRYVTYRAVYDRLRYKGFIAGSGDDGYRRNVRSAIKRIRNKFRELDPAFDEIKNYQGVGYRWGRSTVAD